MKKRTTLLIIAFLFLATSGPLIGSAEKPKISIREVLDIAEEYLEARNLEDEVYIVSVAIENRGIFNRSSFWTARWSKELNAADGGSEIETGIHVTMEGVATRLIKAD